MTNTFANLVIVHKIEIIFSLMSNSGLYSLNKDELVKIICTISADKEKELKELKEVKRKYDFIIDSAISLHNYMGICFACQMDIISSLGDFSVCQRCERVYHDECMILDDDTRCTDC